MRWNKGLGRVDGPGPCGTTNGCLRAFDVGALLITGMGWCEGVRPLDGSIVADILSLLLDLQGSTPSLAASSREGQVRDPPSLKDQLQELLMLLKLMVAFFDAILLPGKLQPAKPVATIAHSY